MSVRAVVQLLTLIRPERQLSLDVVGGKDTAAGAQGTEVGRGFRRPRRLEGESRPEKESQVVTGRQKQRTMVTGTVTNGSSAWPRLCIGGRKVCDGLIAPCRG